MIEIYRITNLINDKCYVGQSKYGAFKRFQQHCKAESLIGKAIRKYGHENFLVEVLESTSDKEVANKLEHYHVVNNDCVVPNGYNMNEYGRLVNGKTVIQPWYICLKPKYYHNIMEQCHNMVKYFIKIMYLANKQFILKRSPHLFVENWTQLFEIVEISKRDTQQKFKKFLLDNNLLELKDKKFILSQEKFKIIY